MTPQERLALVQQLKARLGNPTEEPLEVPEVEPPMPVGGGPGLRPPSRMEAREMEGDTPEMPLMQRAAEAAKQAYPHLAQPTAQPNPELTQAQDALHNFDNPAPEEHPYLNMLKKALESFKYGSMNPAEAMQLQQRENQQSDMTQDRRRQQLAAQLKDVMERQRQGQQDQMAQAREGRESEMFGLNKQAAELNLQKAGAPAPKKYGSRDVERDGKKIREYYDEQNPGMATDTIELGALPPQTPSTMLDMFIRDNPQATAQDWADFQRKNEKPTQGPQPDYEWVMRGDKPMQIRKGSAQPGDRPYDAVAERKQPDASGPSPYAIERADRTIQSIDELSAKVSNWNTGYGSVFSGMPESQARNFKAEMDTLKANIAFNELTAMREASKTGGALGAVSDKEMQLLQSALGALDTGQSPANLKAQLDKIKESVNRWKAAQSNVSTPAGANGGWTVKVKPQ